MGHDITAYKLTNNNELNLKQVSEAYYSEDKQNEFPEYIDTCYLRIQAFDSHTSHLLYFSLDAEECNRGVSGDGFKLFSSGDLIKAKSKYLYYKEEQLIPDDTEANEMLNMILGIFGQDEDTKLTINKGDEPNYESLDKFFDDIQHDKNVLICFS